MMILNFRKTRIVINGKGNLIKGKALKNVHPGFLSFGNKALLNYIFEHLIELSLFSSLSGHLLKTMKRAITRGISPQMVHGLTPVNTITDLENLITFSNQPDQDLQKKTN